MTRRKTSVPVVRSSSARAQQVSLSFGHRRTKNEPREPVMMDGCRYRAGSCSPSLGEHRMEPAEAKDRLKAIEGELADAPFVAFHAFEREGRTLHVAVTERLRKAARKAGVWRSREMLATLKNAAYGFDERRARSIGGRDG